MAPVFVYIQRHLTTAERFFLVTMAIKLKASFLLVILGCLVLSVTSSPASKRRTALENAKRSDADDETFIPGIPQEVEDEVTHKAKPRSDLKDEMNDEVVTHKAESRSELKDDMNDEVVHKVKTRQFDENGRYGDMFDETNASKVKRTPLSDEVTKEMKKSAEDQKPEARSDASERKARRRRARLSRRTEEANLKRDQKSKARRAAVESKTKKHSDEENSN